MWTFSSSGSKKTDEGTTVMTKKSQISYKSGDVSSLILPGSQAFTPKAQGTTMLIFTIKKTGLDSNLFILTLLNYIRFISTTLESPSIPIIKQECIPVGCVAPACCPYLPACTTCQGGVPCLGVYLPRHPPPVNRMTDRCKNITLPQTSFAGSKNMLHFFLCFYFCNKQFHPQIKVGLEYMLYILQNQARKRTRWLVIRERVRLSRLATPTLSVCGDV